MFRTDLITAMKKPDSDVIADSDYAVIDDTWKPEWEKGVQVRRHSTAIICTLSMWMQQHFYFRVRILSLDGRLLAFT